MLLSLRITDFVIVDHLEIDFQSGLSVLSGETGAGKSILLDALLLCLGGKSDSQVIREGAAKTELCAEFSIENQNTIAITEWFAAQDIELTETILLRRVIDNQGRSKAYINGSSATLSQLKQIGEYLIDIHGQHAHQSLLKLDAQRQLFDEHANLSNQTNDVKIAWQAWQKLVEQYKEATEHTEQIKEERERLTWQIEELDKLALNENEWHEINQEHQRLSHAASLLEGSQEALNVLSDNDQSVVDQLNHTISRLQQLTKFDARLEEIVATLEPASIHLQESVSSLQHYLDKSELDPARLQNVEMRLDAIHHTARKYRLTPESIPEHLTSLKTRLNELEQNSDPSKLEAALQEAQSNYMKKAEMLSKARQKAAPTLSQAVTQAMQTLNMQGGSFILQLSPCKPYAYGLEQIECLVAGHAGVTPKSLAKTASGGELARISLALTVITAQATAVPTLIFDEVDTGIGGGVAEVVGKLLRQLGKTRQVLCVTHLPQVAAQGNHHYQVSKTQIDDKTVSRITLLSQAERIDEIARMLGGVNITTTTRQHASEMLTEANQH